MVGSKSVSPTDYKITQEKVFILFIYLICLKIFYWGIIYNDVLVTGVQQSDSVIPIQVAFLFQILFPFKLLKNIETSSLCYRVDPCWLSISNIVVCTCQSQRKDTCIGITESLCFTHITNTSLLINYTPI